MEPFAWSRLTDIPYSLKLTHQEIRTPENWYPRINVNPYFQKYSIFKTYSVFQYEDWNFKKSTRSINGNLSVKDLPVYQNHPILSQLNMLHELFLYIWSLLLQGIRFDTSVSDPYYKRLLCHKMDSKLNWR